MESRIVKQILFDVEYKGHKYTDLDFGYHSDPSVTESYIHDEDGPWAMQQIGDEMFDFQIYGDADTNELTMQACRMYPSSQMLNGELDLCWSHGDFIDTPEIVINNIRVEYN